MKKKTIITSITIISLIIISYLFFSHNADSTQIGIRINNKASSFYIVTVDNGVLDSSELRGKIIILTSFATWCPSCKLEAELLAAVYQKYKDKEVVFLTISIDPGDTKEKIQQFKAEQNTPWYYADTIGGAEIMQKFFLTELEITYIINKKGIITYKDNITTSSSILDRKINEQL